MCTRCWLAVAVGAVLAGCGGAPSGTTDGKRGPVLTVTTEGPGGVEVTGAATADCRGTCSVTVTSGEKAILTPHPDPGALFAGWGGACRGADACDVTLAEDATVTARFEGAPPAQHTLTVSKDGDSDGLVTSDPAGVDCGAACSATFAEGTLVTLTARPGPGLFVGWYGACSGTSFTCALAMTDDVTASATFAQIPLLTHLVVVWRDGTGGGAVTSDPPGLECGSVCNAFFGDGVTLTATPDAGSTFAGWSGGNCSGTGPCYLPPPPFMETLEVTAAFVKAP